MMEGTFKDIANNDTADSGNTLLLQITFTKEIYTVNCKHRAS
jgi:hypothetical protein